MSAPVPDSPSISSSGYNDGLGRREIGFDRETGTLLERLYVRPEIGVFDAAIANRIDKLQSLVDERFARPIAVERDHGRVVVVSEYVSGVRISDLLETSDALQDAPTLDLALGFLLDALPALETFHTTTSVAHGLIASGRTVLASSPKVVFLDSPFGDVLGRLRYSRKRLWRELGLAMPQSAGPSRATMSSDIGQVSLIALMLVLGRAIRDNEYPHALPALVSEVADVALIRGTEAFATALQQFLQTALLISGQGYRSASEALTDVQRVAALEMGAEACGRALAAFVEQIDVGAQPLPAAVLDATPSIEIVGFDDEPAADLVAVDADEETPILLDSPAEVVVEQEIALDPVVESAPLDLALTEDVSSFGSVELPPLDMTAPTFDEPLAPVASSAPAFVEEPAPVEPTPIVEEKTVDDPWSYQPGARDRSVPPAEEPLETPALTAVSFDTPPSEKSSFETSSSAEEPPIVAEPAEPAPAIEPAAAAEDEEAEPARSSFFSPRRKRGEKSRSARARKDKLRSAASAFKDSVIARVTHQADPAAAKPPRDAESRTPDVPPAPEPPRAPERPRAGEPVPEPLPPPRPKPIAPLIPASRAASFEPPVPDAAAPPLPRPFSTPVPAVTPTIAAAPPPQPMFDPPAPPPPMPSFSAPSIPLTPPAPPVAPPSIQLKGAPPISLSGSAPAAPSAPTLKLKTPVAPKRRESYEPPPADFPQFPVAADPGPRQFPWKLAAAAAVIMLAGVVAGRAYILPDKKVEEQRAAKEAAEIAANTKLPPAKRGPGAVPMGKLVIESDQRGARVLLDTVFVGETPLTIEKPAGKYTLTVGAVTKRITVQAGKTTTESISLVSGWVAIFAPITFDVSEQGQFIANTEQDGRILLPPGPHELRLTNKALGYSSVHKVHIQPTEVLPLTIEPKGRVSFNATPGWAEVWLEGKKLGDTPHTDELPLGVHNFVFKHPEFGERKATETIRADRPAAVSVDYNK